MKVGYHVGQVIFRGLDLQRQWQEHLEQFRAVRDAGFDRFSWGHHYLIDPFQHFQPIPVLARLAAEAGTMELATQVILTPLLNPVQVAEEVATLDHICQGHFVFGIGLGYRPEECEAFGIQMKERVARFEEGLALMKRLWTEADVTHHGKFYHVTGARPTARPYQRPYPPIWIAAQTDAAVRRAGRLGHPFHCAGMQTFEDVKRQKEIWLQALAEHGHPVPQHFPVSREFFVAETREQALKRARTAVEAKYRAYAMHGLPDAARAISEGLDQLLNGPFVVGNPEECVEKLARYKELGVSHISIRIFWPEMTQRDVLAMIELAAARVLPALQRL